MKKIAPFLITLVLCFSAYSRKDPDFTIGFVVFISIFGMGLSAGMILKSLMEHFQKEK